MKNKQVKLFLTVMAVPMIFYLIFIVFSSFLKKDSSFSIAGAESQLLQHVAFLSDEVRETSGLAYHNNQLFTHNDAGNQNVMYALNKENGKIQNRFIVSGAQNIDWEDLAQNDTHIFVGDIGNNDGIRKDQKIYKIRKSALAKGSGNVESDGTIGFRFSDQTQFNSNKKHNFDTEALIYYKDNLYLFSKNRGGTLCNVYRIPSKSGIYEAELIDSFNIPGLITGAAISPSNSRIILTAYNKKDNCFLYSLDNFKNDKFFSGKHTLINLGPYTDVGQLEGVVFEDEENIFLSTEKTKDRKAGLYKLKLRF